MTIDFVMTRLNDGEPFGMDDIRAIAEHGCASYARPASAVYYYKAVEAMASYGNAIVEFIDSEIPALDPNTQSYEGWCCDVVSMAVEMWCQLQLDLEYEYEMERTERDIEPSEYTEWQDYDPDC